KPACAKHRRRYLSRVAAYRPDGTGAATILFSATSAASAAMSATPPIAARQRTSSDVRDAPLPDSMQLPSEYLVPIRAGSLQWRARGTSSAAKVDGFRKASPHPTDCERSRRARMAVASVFTLEGVCAGCLKRSVLCIHRIARRGAAAVGPRCQLDEP